MSPKTKGLLEKSFLANELSVLVIWQNKYTSRNDFVDVDVKCDQVDLHSKFYHLASCDLRRLEDVESKLQQCDCDYGLPTIFLAECVLVYMPYVQSNNLLSWISDKFSSLFFINYEQVCILDAALLIAACQ